MLLSIGIQCMLESVYAAINASRSSPPPTSAIFAKLQTNRVLKPLTSYNCIPLLLSFFEDRDMKLFLFLVLQFLFEVVHVFKILSKLVYYANIYILMPERCTYELGWGEGGGGMYYP